MGDKLNINRLTAEAVELLKGMIAIPSPSFSEEEVCTHICGWLTEKGVAHERVGRNIIAEHIVDAAMPTLMMCAHIDTVNASPEYSFDPFLPDYEAAAKAIGAASGTDGCEHPDTSIRQTPFPSAACSRNTDSIFHILPGERYW